MWFRLAREVLSGKNQILQVLNNPNLLNVVREITPNDTTQLVVAYFLNQNIEPNTLKNDLVPELTELIQKNKIKFNSITKESIVMNGETYNSFLPFSEDIHGITSSINPTPTIEVQISDDDLKITEGEIRVIPINNVVDAIKHGMDQSWCIAQPGNSMYQSYRDTQNSTFYFIFDGTRTFGDPLRKVAVDVHENGVALTDTNNTTGTIAEFGSNWKAYFNYLQSKGIDTSKFINKPKTEAELEENRIIGNQNTDLRWFKQLPYKLKANYIGRGHLLTDEQFMYLKNTNAKDLMKQYADTGIPIPETQFKEMSTNIQNTYKRKINIAIDVVMNNNQIYTYRNKINDNKSQTAAFLMIDKLPKDRKRDHIHSLSDALMSDTLGLEHIKYIEQYAPNDVDDFIQSMNIQALEYIQDKLKNSPESIMRTIRKNIPMQPDTAEWIMKNIVGKIKTNNNFDLLGYDTKIEYILSRLPKEKLLHYFQRSWLDGMPLELFAILPKEDQIKALQSIPLKHKNSFYYEPTPKFKIDSDVLEGVIENVLLFNKSFPLSELFSHTDKEGQRLLLEKGVSPNNSFGAIDPDLTPLVIKHLKNTYDISNLAFTVLSTYPEKYIDFIGHLDPDTILRYIDYNADFYRHLLSIGASPSTIWMKSLMSKNNTDLLIDLSKHGINPVELLMIIHPDNLQKFLSSGAIKQKLNTEDIRGLYSSYINPFMHEIVFKLIKEGWVEISPDLFNAVPSQYWYSLKQIYDKSENAGKPLELESWIHPSSHYKAFSLGAKDFDSSYGISYRLYPPLVNKGKITPNQALSALNNNISDSIYQDMVGYDPEESQRLENYFLTKKIPEAYIWRNYNELKDGDLSTLKDLKSQSSHQVLRNNITGARGYSTQRQERERINRTIKWLVEKGGDPNIILPNILGSDQSMIKWLIEQGADGRNLLTRVEQIASVNSSDDLKTMLYLGGQVPKQLQDEFLYKLSEFDTLANSKTIDLLLSHGFSLEDIFNQHTREWDYVTLDFLSAVLRTNNLSEEEKNNFYKKHYSNIEDDPEPEPDPFYDDQEL